MSRDGNGWNGEASPRVAVFVGVKDRRRDLGFREEVGAILDALRAAHCRNRVQLRALQREIDAEREHSSEARAALVRVQTLQQIERATARGGANDA